ncbi:Piso0_001532 [Millerozyma farinosa CBS 7064]|uniref:Piso0_001532 protein n=1 Tax=Pichia sorbitophila (strain ATCC MYA-4447 / BCRC 22081 / CBS 7064 / NBRC 10061 / NRRL Y-12695) TaxID=559304 RepID=G8YNE9_PICSO|nr:Piso0_001532 [Millerozyma farinosa CBS 7064]
MAGKTRKGLSYMLGDSNEKENHILPINAIQFSSITEQIYTGGRDGTVKTWSCDSSWDASRQTSVNDFDFEKPHKFNEYAYTEEKPDPSEEILKLETSISSNPLSCSGSREDYSITNNYNIHFDWVNDLALINNDRDLVSCSSDLSVKLINLHSPGHPESCHVHKFPNLHTDYIKKLTYISPKRTVVSGGLDGKIVLWDVNTLTANQVINMTNLNSSAPSSIYSLATNGTHMVGAGGPSNTVNLYDTRQNSDHVLKKLIGHQDNIRSLIMNDKFLLSGSSDSTIKLWDLRNFKVSKTFEVHEDAVWCLATYQSSSPGVSSQGYSPDYDFKVFFSGDKSGNIIKTDLSELYSHSTSRVSPEFDTITESDEYNIDEKLGVCTLMAKESSPVLNICCEVDTSHSSGLRAPSLLTSTEVALNRYHVPNTADLSRYQYLRTSIDYFNNENQANENLPVGLGEVPSDQNDINSDIYDIASQLTVESNNFDLQSSISGVNYSRSIQNTDPQFGEPTMNKKYFSLFLDIGGGPSTEFVNIAENAIAEESQANGGESAIISNLPVEILLNPIPEECITVVPYNKRPFGSYSLVPKSIIAKRFFNNKRHMIVLYLNGDIKIWDLFIFKVIKSIPVTENMHESRSDLIERRIKDMESIFFDYQTHDTLSNWCDVEIKSGKLLVTLKETSFNNVEIYYDDLIASYPFLSQADSPFKDSEIKMGNDDRLMLSRIIMNSLFREYVLHEWDFDRQLRNALRIQKLQNRKAVKSNTNDNDLSGLSNSSHSSNSPVSGELSTLNNAVKKVRMFSRKSSKNNVNAQPQEQSPKADNTNESIQSTSSISSEVSRFIRAESSSEENTEDSISNLLHFNKRRYNDRYNSLGLNAPVKSLLKIYSNDPRYSSHEPDKVSKPLIPSSQIPSNLLIIIFEHSPELGTLRDICSFHYEEILHINDFQNEHLVSDLRQHLPSWVGKLILYDSFPMKEYPKIEFQLSECNYALLPPGKKIGGKSDKKIKKLPVNESSIKLSSHSMLRVSKIFNYLVERFDGKTPEMKMGKPVWEWLVLECKGVELDTSLTLQAIKTKIWKKNSEIEMTFRRRFDP